MKPTKWETTYDDDGTFRERRMIAKGVYQFIELLDMWNHCGKEGSHYAVEARRAANELLRSMGYRRT
jgi:hypothetical protein